MGFVGWSRSIQSGNNIGVISSRFILQIRRRTWETKQPQDVKRILKEGNYEKVRLLKKHYSKHLMVTFYRVSNYLRNFAALLKKATWADHIGGGDSDLSHNGDASGYSTINRGMWN